MTERLFERTENDLCRTLCPKWTSEGVRIGSQFCSECRHNQGQSAIAPIVYCDWEGEKK